MEIRPILSALLRSKTGAVLVAVQVALSLAILANALHIVAVRQAVAARPSGVAAEADVFSLQIRHLKAGSHQQQLAEQKAEAATLRGVPGVLSVANVSQLPMTRSGSYSGVAASRAQAQDSGSAALYSTPDGLLKTWGLQLREGRDFAPQEVLEVDQDTSEEFAKTVIVTRALAQRLWPDSASALGQTLYFGTGDKANASVVVGVVERLQTPGAQLKGDGELSVIVPIRYTGGSDSNFTLRAEPGRLERTMRDAEAAARAAAAAPVIVRLKSLAEVRADRYRADRGLSGMLVAVSALLLLVTASGIVGMASLWVTQRRKQIGVRRALGARRVDILRYFLVENVMITSVGVAAGVLLGLALNALLVSQLEMTRLPAPYLAAGAGVFWLLGLGAVYGPAWRAASTSPALATRSA
ncbi:ABC transporter permease [Rugamonas rubra]|uniref:Putative ABC transport system permease protein n=1 Tax=Rugamonas rubra TaxID=758825 RepID=A0A1I4U539_9BURK|nr:FtsX-like permease family protein [Rugamonas rubra]SFM84102.1 putative ABC transport system permease protein [Rugamonas rubra]